MIAHIPNCGTYAPPAGGAKAVYNSSGLQYYRHADWLGSTRLASTPTRIIYYDGAYAPYGENYAETGNQDREFAGMEQDIVSSGAYPLYDALMREYHPTWGRWLSPDPAGLAAADPANPQTWNRYAYVANSPLTFIDPLGLIKHVPSGCKADSTGFAYTCPDGWAGGDAGSTYALEVLGRGPHWGVLAILPLRPISNKLIKSLLPQVVNCDAALKQAAQLARELKRTAGLTGFGTLLLGIGTGLSGAAEVPTLGADSPVTGALFLNTTVLGAITVYSRGLAAALDSLAQGNPIPLENFAFGQALESLAFHGLVSKFPTVGPAIEKGYEAAKAGKELSDKAKEGGCK